MSINDAEKIFKYVLPNIVQISACYDKNNFYRATGVLYQYLGRSVILTAGHVIGELKNTMESGQADAYITLQNQQLNKIIITRIKDTYKELENEECFLSRYDEYKNSVDDQNINDVGFIEINSTQISLLTPINIHMVSHMELGKTNEELFITGFPSNNNGRNEAIPLKDAKRIFIASEDYLDFSYSPPSFLMERDEFMGGYSGSGVFAEHQGTIVLVGIVSHAPSDKKEERYEERAVSVKVIRDFLETHDLINTDILPNYNTAISFINREFNPEICDYFDSKYALLKDYCLKKCNGVTEEVKVLKTYLGCNLQKEQGFLFCEKKDYQCQEYWDKRLFWTLIMLILTDKELANWEKIPLPIVEDNTVWGEFLCSEGEIYDLIKRMLLEFASNTTTTAENTIFFWNSKEKQGVPYTLSNKAISRIIDITASKIPNYEERSKLKNNFFDITTGDRCIEWAITDIESLQNIVCNSQNKNELIKKILGFLKHTVWNN